MKMKVFLDHTISINGVEKVWRWECPHNGCKALRINYNHAVYWDNAIRGALHHVEWHKRSPVADWGSYA